MSEAQPTPLEAADHYVATAKASREFNDTVRASVAAMKQGAAELMAFPSDHLAEALCQPKERVKILQLRKSLGQLLDSAEMQQRTIDTLVRTLELSAEMSQRMQRSIDSQDKELEAYRNG